MEGVDLIKKHFKSQQHLHEAAEKTGEVGIQ